ncbi:hypothetical protein ABIB62_002684 [Mucilaginibacter sp. UYP25]
MRKKSVFIQRANLRKYTQKAAFFTNIYACFPRFKALNYWNVTMWKRQGYLTFFQYSFTMLPLGNMPLKVRVSLLIW